MESTNQAASGNQMTLHTTDGCTMSGVQRKMTGTVLNTNCYNGTDDNKGCGVQGAPATFGPAFNSAGGGVMALEWRSAGIRMWQFARAAIPADVSGAGPPRPSTWGEALADFPDTDCGIASHFKNQSIIVDIDLCGSLTESVYAQSGCKSFLSLSQMWKGLSSDLALSFSLLTRTNPQARASAPTSSPTSPRRLPTPIGSSTRSRSTRPRTLRRSAGPVARWEHGIGL